MLRIIGVGNRVWRDDRFPEESRRRYKRVSIRVERRGIMGRWRKDKKGGGDYETKEKVPFVSVPFLGSSCRNRSLESARKTTDVQGMLNGVGPL